MHDFVRQNPIGPSEANLGLLDNFQFPLCGAYKAILDEPESFVLLIGVYPHLQAIGLGRAARAYPTLEKGEPRSKTVQISKHKNSVAAFVKHMVLEKAFQPSLVCGSVFFLFGLKLDRFWADTANSDILRSIYFTARPSCSGKGQVARDMTLLSPP